MADEIRSDSSPAAKDDPANREALPMTGKRQSEPRYDAPDQPRRNVSKEDLQQQPEIMTPHEARILKQRAGAAKKK